MVRRKGKKVFVDAEEFNADADMLSHGIHKIKSVGDVLAGRVEQGIVIRLQDGAATPGDDGIYMIKGVGDVLVGRVESTRLAWEKAACARMVICGGCAQTVRRREMVRVLLSSD